MCYLAMKQSPEMTNELLATAKNIVTLLQYPLRVSKALPALHAACKSGDNGALLCELQQFWDACDGAATAAMPSTHDSADAF